MPGTQERDEAGCCFDAILRELDGAGLDCRTVHGRADLYRSIIWATTWRKRWDMLAYKIGNAFLTAFALGAIAIAAFGAILWSGHIKVD